MLSNTDDPEELHERASTFWLALTLDRYCALTTGWAESLGEEQISTLLVPAHGAYPAIPDQDFTSALCIHLPSFATAHPAELCGPLQLYVKAIVLAGRVASWLQHSSISCGTPPTKLPQYLIDTDAFQNLHASLRAFITSLPRNYSPADLARDPRLVLALTLPHAAIVLLHEGLCGWDPADLARQRCLEGAAGVLERVYALFGSSFDFSRLSPYNCFVFAIAGRTFVRELAVKRRAGVGAGVVELGGAVEAIIGAMKACRTPLGGVSAATLTGLLANPGQCDPTHEPEQEHPPHGQHPPAPFLHAQAYAEAYPAYPADRRVARQPQQQPQPYQRDIKEEQQAAFDFEEAQRRALQAHQQQQQQGNRPGSGDSAGTGGSYSEAERGVAAGLVGEASGWGTGGYAVAGHEGQGQQGQPHAGFGWQCGGGYPSQEVGGQQEAFLRLN